MQINLVLGGDQAVRGTANLCFRTKVSIIDVLLKLSVKKKICFSLSQKLREENSILSTCRHKESIQFINCDIKTISVTLYTMFQLKLI